MVTSCVKLKCEFQLFILCVCLILIIWLSNCLGDNFIGDSTNREGQWFETIRLLHIHSCVKICKRVVNHFSECFWIEIALYSNCEQIQSYGYYSLKFSQILFVKRLRKLGQPINSHSYIFLSWRGTVPKKSVKKFCMCIERKELKTRLNLSHHRSYPREQHGM